MAGPAGLAVLCAPRQLVTALSGFTLGEVCTGSCPAVLLGMRELPPPLTAPALDHSAAPACVRRTIANQRNIEIDLNRLHWTPYRQEPPAKK